ncbi:MAG: TrkH family potassium uptake protein [Sedimentisphaeraceae bacterium JB056]
MAYLRENWLEIPMLFGLVVISLFSSRFFPTLIPEKVIGTALGVYLIIQVVDKLCRFTVRIAATGRNPMRILVISFIVLILGGAGFLMLPTFHNNGHLSVVDACFTTTSAACVTGLIVKDTGSDFTIYGQFVILILIQLGGLGIVIFGAVIAQLFGKAFSLSESVAMQDLLSADTVSRIGRMIGFVFMFTIIAETLGAAGLYSMWDTVSGIDLTAGQKIYYSVFHSISAFCNAGFALFGDSFMKYAYSGEIYWVVCPLIVIGGLGFSVLYNISNLIVDKFRILLYKFTHPADLMLPQQPKRLRLQSKITLLATGCLIIGGTIGFMVLMKNHPGNAGLRYENGFRRFMDAAFMSVTSRTAGFNTVDISQLSGASKLWTIVLMCIGGSPGSTAGGIKTVTLVVLVMAVWTTVLGRGEVEIFKRSIRYVIIGRALTVMVFYIIALLVAIFALCVTERQSDFTMMDIAFEAASAMGTVGLSTGITAALSSAGKVVIIAAMLTGRLGPLTLLASFMFNTKTSKYSYPDEAVVVG